MAISAVAVVAGNLVADFVATTAVAELAAFAFAVDVGVIAGATSAVGDVSFGLAEAVTKAAQQ